MQTYPVRLKGRLHTYLTLYVGLLPLLISCAQRVGDLPPMPPEEQQQQIPQEYHIGPEDVVEVMVWKNEDLSRVVNVRPDGKISLPLIGDVQAAGLTAEQLNETIAAELKRYYKESPQVSVIVQQVNSYAIYILGQVQNPGRYVVKSGTTFLQALSLSGGFGEFAATSRIIVRRQNSNNGGETAMRFRFKDVVVGKQNNILLKPGDTIIVP